MKTELNIVLLEFNIAWEQPKVNFDRIESLIPKEKVDLIVLPEMFATGFSMNVENVAEDPFGKSYHWMKQISIEKNVAICGSVSTKENEKHYNRFYFVNKDEVFTYDKKHLFGYGKETDVYSAGNEIVEFEFKGWKIRPIVCYDLRFPVWCRNTTDYDLMICVANWPKQRIEAWLSLLKARAIENMAYVVGVNRLGTDGNELEYNGNSAVFDELGNRRDNGKQGVKAVKLNKDSIKINRQKFGFLRDRDNFSLD